MDVKRRFKIFIVAWIFGLMQLMPLHVTSLGAKKMTLSFQTLAAPTINSITVKTVDNYAIVIGNVVSHTSIMTLNYTLGNELNFTISGTGINSPISITLNQTNYNDLVEIGDEIQKQILAAENNDITVTTTMNASNNGANLIFTRMKSGLTLTQVKGNLSDIGLTAGPYAATTKAAISLSPTVEYDITVNVTEPDKILDPTGGLKQLELKLWYDELGTDFEETNFDDMTSPDTKNYVNMKWSNPNNFTYLPIGKTWEFTSKSTISATATNQDFTFRVKVGKVASETIEDARWQIGAKVTDMEDATDYLYYEESGGTKGLKVNWYGELSLTTTTSIDFGRVPSGLEFSSAKAAFKVKDMMLLANGEYEERIRADEYWYDGSDRITRSALGEDEGEFALRAGNLDQYSSLTTQEIPSDGITSVALNNYPANNDDLVGTSVNNVLFLKLHPSILRGKSYSGYITYLISNH